MIAADEIFSIKNGREFEAICLNTFQYQANQPGIYHDYLRYLGRDPQTVNSIQEIPFLPIEFFKTRRIILPEDAKEEIVFTSSGTTGTSASSHFVSDLSLYEESFRRAFSFFYGPVDDWVILALLPSYRERSGSSLIYMVDALIQQSGNPESAYVLNQPEPLWQLLEELKSAGKKTMLIGVTYALLDFVENLRISFPDLVIMETGGMKGRRKEMIREELHAQLKRGFDVPDIHSEYGMTELLSQAYSKGKGVFHCPPWMKVLARDLNDPFSWVQPGKTGGISVIDLVNQKSCAFIATQDLGQVSETGSFEILGRFDHSDLRGCNLLVQ